MLMFNQITLLKVNSICFLFSLIVKHKPLKNVNSLNLVQAQSVVEKLDNNINFLQIFLPKKNGLLDLT